MHLRLNKLGKLIASLAVISMATPAFAQDDEEPEKAIYSCGKKRGRVSVSFKPEVEIKDLVTWAMGFTCKNFVFAPGVISRKGKVTIIAPKKMSRGQAWNLFLTSLEAMKLTVVPKGNVLKIVEVQSSKKETLPLYTGRRAPGGAQMIRMVIRPSHITSDDATTALNAMVSKDGVVTNMTKQNMVMVTDYGDSIRRMRQLMREIDAPSSGDRLYMIRVKHGDAEEMAKTLSDILGVNSSANTASQPTRRTTRRGRGRRTTATTTTTTGAKTQGAIPKRILSEERTNSLIVVGSFAAYRRVKALAARIDVQVDGVGGGRIHVYYLDHADAEEMSTTLQAVISGVQQQSSSAQRNQRTTTRRPVPRRTSTSANGAGTAAFEGEVNVAFDKPTNSLVIVASIRDFYALRDVIRRLDVKRKQVFIEAFIFEVSVSNSLDLGSSFHGGLECDGSIILGGHQGGEISSLNFASLATQQGLLGGLIGPLLPNAENLIGTSIPSYGVLFQALAGSDAVNIISTPHILTTDNEEAVEAIGENIPYLAGIGAGFGAGTAQTQGAQLFPQQNVQRRDIELNLKVTPQVSQSGQVRMNVELKLEDVASANFGDQGLGPSWSKREITTVATVPDQETVVIGGLMRTRETSRESKVPILGDIPVIGSLLFKYKTTSKSKSNLLVMLTPYVIDTQAQLVDIRRRKDRERMEFVRTNSNFDAIEFRPNLDYRKKRGLVEEIISTARRFERERKELEELESRRIDFEDGAIEDYGNEEEEDDAEEDDDETPTSDKEKADEKKDGADKGKADEKDKPVEKSSKAKSRRARKVSRR